MIYHICTLYSVWMKRTCLDLTPIACSRNHCALKCIMPWQENSVQTAPNGKRVKHWKLFQTTCIRNTHVHADYPTYEPVCLPPSFTDTQWAENKYFIWRTDPLDLNMNGSSPKLEQAYWVYKSRLNWKLRHSTFAETTKNNVKCIANTCTYRRVEI